jgi:nucleoside-diphosphate-sugar epimerase
VRVLLTGAAGFIGSHLCDRLLADGAGVLGVDNLLTGRRENIEHLQTNSRFCLLEHDAITPFDVGEPVDWILHFASPASPPKYLARPTETLRVNSEGTYRLLELARRHRAKFFLASTSEVYGDPAVHPQVESYWGNVNPIGPRSVYDEAKRYAEAITMSYARSYGLSVRVVRIFNTYGPRMDLDDGRVVTNFITQALAGCPLTVYGSGTQTRSLQYVDDLVEGVLRLMDIEWTTPVNIGNPEEYTMTELASLVIELTGSRSTIVREPLPVDDPKRRRPDITVARDVLGWEPRVSVRQGLTRTIAHYRERLSAAVCP